MEVGKFLYSLLVALTNNEQRRSEFTEFIVIKLLVRRLLQPFTVAIYLGLLFQEQLHLLIGIIYQKKALLSNCAGQNAHYVYRATVSTGRSRSNSGWRGPSTQT